MWSNAWPAMDGVVCLSILLEGRVTVSNNFTKWRQNGSKIGTRDAFTTHLSYENFLSNEIVIYIIILGSVIFPYNSLYTQAVAYTTYFELGEPVEKPRSFILVRTDLIIIQSNLPLRPPFVGDHLS